jgi:cytochrome c biogenesis protein CcdA
VGCSTAGFLLPVLYSQLSKEQGKHIAYSLMIIKAFSAGVILSVAFLHLLSESIAELNNFYSYPVGLLMAIFGLLFTVVLKSVVNFSTSSYESSTLSTEGIQMQSVVPTANIDPERDGIKVSKNPERLKVHAFGA